MLQRVLTTFYEWNGVDTQAEEFDKHLQDVQHRVGKAIKYLLVFMALMFAYSIIKN